MGKVISRAPPDSRAIRKIAPEIHVWRHCPTHTSHFVCVCVCVIHIHSSQLCVAASHSLRNTTTNPIAARHQFAIVSGGGVIYFNCQVKIASPRQTTPAFGGTNGLHDCSQLDPEPDARRLNFICAHTSCGRNRGAYHRAATVSNQPGWMGSRSSTHRQPDTLLLNPILPGWWGWWFDATKTTPPERKRSKRGCHHTQDKYTLARAMRTPQYGERQRKKETDREREGDTHYWPPCFV